MMNQNIGEPKQESVDLKEYLFILLKRKWLILLCFLLSMAGTTAYLYTRQPIYRATARLLVTYAGRDMPTANIQSEGRTFFGTAASVMRSQVMLRRVQQRMKKTPAEFRENLSQLSITPVRASDIILVAVNSPSRDFAREFANVLCDEYLRFREEQQASSSESALLALTREINRLSVEAKTAHQRVIDYAREHNMPLLTSTATGIQEMRYYRSVEARSLAETEVTRAKMRKQLLDSAVDTATVLAIVESDSRETGTNSVVDESASARLFAPTGAGDGNDLLLAGSRFFLHVENRPDLSGEYTVSEDGQIDVPIAGKMTVLGRTSGQVSRELEQELTAKLEAPVTVGISTSPTSSLRGETVSPLGDALESSLDISPKGYRTTLGLLTTTQGETLYQLESARQELLRRLVEMRKTYKPQHPAILRVEAEKAQKEAKIQSTIEFMRQKAAAELELAQQRLIQVRANTTAADSRATEHNVQIMELDNLRDEYGRIQRLHEMLVNKLLNIDMKQSFSARNVQVMEPAIVQDTPVYPKKTKGMLVAAFGGLGLGLALAFFIEYIDDSIKLAEDVERDLQLSFLGMIPAAQWNPDDLKKHRLDQLQTRGGIAEAYRVARSAILFSVPREKLRSMLVTSAVPREGKTTTGVNMAIGFSQIEDRVLLVDGDLRRGEIHKYFGLPRERGFADVLLGEATPEEVVKRTDVPKLDIISTGEYPTNPAELLLGWRLKEFLDWAQKHYNRVIFDGPPVMGIADSAIIGSAVDGVLLVIWAGRTSRRYVRVAKMTAASRGAKIIGFVLNNLEPGRVGFYHYYPYYYSYYYRGYYSDQNEKPKAGAARKPMTAAAATAAPETPETASAPAGVELPMQPPPPDKDIEDVY